MGSSPADLAQLRSLFAACDVNGSGLVELEDFASVCRDLGVQPGLVGPLFRRLDVDRDGIIDFHDFAARFEEVSEALNLSAFQPPEMPPGWGEAEGRMGVEVQYLTSETRERLWNLYQEIQGLPVPGLLEQYEKLIENMSYDHRVQRLNNEKLESVLKRTEEKTAMQMAELEEDLQLHLAKVEGQIRGEERHRLTAAIQELQRKHDMEKSDLQARIDRMAKHIDEQRVQETKEESTKLRNQIFDLSQENELLKRNLLETQTSISLLQTELDRLKNDFSDQQMHHEREKELLKSMIEESTGYTNQIQILNYHSSWISVLPHNWSSQNLADRNKQPVFQENKARCLARYLYFHYTVEFRSEVDGKIKWTPSRPVSRSGSTASSKRRLPAFTPKKEGLELGGSQVSSPIYRLVLAGDAGSGKSSFLLRLCLNEFRGDIPTTLGVDFQMKKLLVDGQHTTLQIWDTAGQERFRSIAKSYFRKAHGVLLMYDVTSETSFLNVRQWIDEIKNSCDKSIPLMLIGNKTDLRVEVNESRAIQTSMGEKLAMAYGSLFCETSAKDGTNVVEAVLHLAREVKKTVNPVEENKASVTKLSIPERTSMCCKI
ncbi:ras and EF-hand domain-containing protein-like [Hyperolius riggenbachi]|uniref:ras and EF-hand domain-containing protein-like n=1 Tax=Hyperolius riggenbachi TaxID=752182 RepID=UPI0035A3526C